AFGENTSGLIESIVRIDATGHMFAWTPEGHQLSGGEVVERDQELWQWASTHANASQVRMVRDWSSETPSRRVLVIPVWHNSPSIETPTPLNDFNGVLSLVIDVNRFAEVYLGPAMIDPTDTRMVVGLDTPQFGVRIGAGHRGVASSPGDEHNHADRQGTTIRDGADGRQLHTWAKFDAADESWVVAASASYDLVAGQIRRSAMGQLALTAVLLVSVPLAGWLIARRERQAQLEQRQLERRLAESQKMEAIGKLAGGVAHDFNNLLTAILGYATIIRQEVPPDSPIREHAAHIDHAAGRAASLTQKLLAFSRRQLLQSDVMDFRSVLDNLLPLLRGAVGADITITTEIGEDLWPIMADSVQTEQSLLNLGINARDAMPNGGTLRIEAHNAPRPAGERRPDVDLKPGDYVQITVTDTGTGMDDTTRERMFEPFFTTKPVGKGTGLGLSTVYGFVRQCGGAIGVTTAPGEGTSIEVFLPRALRAATAPAMPPARTEARHAGKETVLVAEDEQGVRELAVESLERRGYRVLAAASGEEALRIAAGYGAAIDLLVSDVIMPGMKGTELAERLRATRPGTRVLLMSGYAADVVTAQDLRDAPLLSKPFSPATLIKAVRAALDIPLSSSPAPQG
ncbi:MAG TPA: response regulator, partial [Vicinamibacterales bacterium]